MGKSAQLLWKFLSSINEQKPRKSRMGLKRLLTGIEKLECRNLCAGDLRTFDGTGNNLANPQWGSTDEVYIRLIPPAYADGIATPAGSNRLSAREISNGVATQGPQNLINDSDMSAFVYAWGQFLDHDIDLTDSASPTESFEIAIPKGDSSFDPFATGTKSMGMTRSKYDPATGTSKSTPRQQVNSISSFIDASQVYGSTAERAIALRTMQGGKMKTSSGNLLPLNSMGIENATMPGTPDTSYFIAGDVRANENIELTAMQTLFVREHNRLAEKFSQENPSWTDEQIYQQARRWVGAEMQVITYNEFLPSILGSNALPRYSGYKPNVNPTISNEFATAAFRFGHSMIGADIKFLDNQGAEVRDAIGLRESFFSPSLIQANGIDTIMKYLASDRAQAIDTHIVDDLRNFLFGAPGAGGMDLAALNIQRGRDHGLADYNSVRRAYGLAPVRTFADITKNLQLQASLSSVYKSVDNIDLWVGGLAEDHLPGSNIGPLFGRIIANQFQRLRDGDRFWYERDFQGRELTEIRSTTLASIVQNNTTTSNLQSNVFEFRVEIQGKIFADINRNGIAGPRESGLPGVLVQLQDSNGQVIASVRTERNGSYRFKGLDSGTYRIRVAPPANMVVTTTPPRDFVVTKGSIQYRVDFGLAALVASPLKSSILTSSLDPR